MKPRLFLQPFLLLPLACAPLTAASNQPQTPVIVPAGPVLSVDPGKILALQASAEGAETFEWKLQGKGSIADANSPAVFYTAPEDGGTMALLTVIARNGAGVSPASSITVSVRSRALMSLDAAGIPAGWMSGKDPASFIELANGSNCRPGSQCMKFTYKFGGGWGGVYWWPIGCGSSGTPAAWEAVKSGSCAIDVRKAAGFGEVRSLSFWIRGANGGEVIELKTGGPDILPSPGRSLGKITLDTGWKQHRIELSGVDMSRAVGLFVWIAEDLANPQGAVFYLQDVQFEGLKP